MPSGKNLGLFWDNNAFCIVESQQDVPQKIFKVPHHPLPEVDPVAPVAPFANVEEIRFIGPLKAALQANNITTTDVNLVLPSKDIIIRSFVIPFLKSSEIRGVVEFEIKKYIPFNVKDIAFNYHAVTYVEDKVKRMRVHFVAIRKDILERYKIILKQAGLNVVYSEPAAMCVVRALLQKKIIRFDQRVGVVHPDFSNPGIMVVDKGVVQFVRDFQLQNPTLNLAPLDIEMLKKKLFNEIKISLDFYMRQFKREKLDDLLSLSFESGQDLTSELQKELEIPTKKVNLQHLAKFSDIPDLGVLAAHGVNLREIAKTLDFNLSGSVASSDQSSQFKEWVPEEYIPIIKVAVVCAAFLAVVLVLTKMNIAQYKKKYDLIADSQGPFVDMKADEIQTRIADNRKKLKDYQKTYEPSQMAYILTHVAKVIPQGMWLTDVDIRFSKNTEGAGSIPPVDRSVTTSDGSEQSRFLSLDISGHVYDKDSNQQFKMVYAFVNQLKTDEILKKFAKSVVLANIQSEQLGEEVVTGFKIRIR